MYRDTMSTHDRYSVDSGDGESLRDIQARLRAEALAAQGPSHAHAHSSAEHVVRQPLLDLSREDYKDEKEGQRYYDDEDDEDEGYEYTPGCCDLNDEKSCLSRTRGFVRSRNGAKVFAALLALALAILSSIYWILLPHLVDKEMRHGFVNPVKDGQESINTIGVSRGGEFQHGVVKIQDLDERFIPGGEQDPHGKRRLIFVGDIHGCKKELLNLLDKVEFDPDWDHFIATGDTINKGPHSAAVLDQLIDMNATTVRGNHEDRLIHTAKTVYDTFASSPESSLPPLQDTDSLVGVTSASHRDAKTLKSLRARHLRYIQQMPLILRIRALPRAAKTSSRASSPIAEPIVVVHAGLVPALPLEKQDPYYVTNMRSLHPKSHVPSADRAGKGGKKVGRHNKPWRTVWNWYNDRLYRHKSTKGFRKFGSLEAPQGTVLTGADVEKRDLYDENQGLIGSMMGKVEGTVREFTGRGKNDHKHDRDEKPQVVVYGHDARSGLQIKRWTKGMDSGCVGGGRLSALVLNAKGEGKVVSVGCHQYW